MTIEGAVEPAARLSWSRAEGPPAANLAGYRVHWRLTTEPQWTHSRYVGDVESHRLDGMVIDRKSVV